MWIFTRDGFLSAVAHRDQPDHLMVRARERSHLQSMIDFAKSYEPIVVSNTPSADYHWRCVVSKRTFAAFMAEQIQGIDYDNFKGSLADADYHDACLGVWQTMHDFQTPTIIIEGN
ncbi:MAG: hypothetical protein RI556_01450 [Hydrogenovibrio sp.]|uniref:hypothetical protein n=1 Tax=Hydrogenovibrio sp. TaxID=2065821 RepID=UPI00286FCF59|nr:hypothetical protein [Hydrogenovibrio sp.]MDR9497813.1 hypothetical protein [Hydrogenovibrio sp.]